MKRTIEDLGEWDWSLTVRDGNVVASKAIPHDGVLTYSTEDRRNCPDKNSEYGLSPREVVRRYVRESDTDRAADDLLALVTPSQEVPPPR